MSDHSHATTSDAHADHSPEEIKKHMRTYALVGAALMVGTGLTVWASYIDFGSRVYNIIVALVIAITKGSLVGAFFMHLISEKKMIYAVMIATVFFFVALMFLTLWSMDHTNIIQMH